jgi:hypothetical protein
MLRACLTASMLLALVGGCGPASTTIAKIPKDGAVDSADDGACDSADAFAASHAPNDPCAVDSDCHDPLLVCMETTKAVCRGDGEVLELGCPATFVRGVPVCPETVNVTIHVCRPTNVQPCNVDTDCGPNGLLCVGGRCAQKLCATVADCPQGWGCYAPCPACPGTIAQKRCEPPGAVFRCPQCIPVPDVQDAGVDGDASD